MNMRMKIEKGVEGLIFDLDGTLVDSMPVHRIAWEEICSAEGFTFTDELFYGYAGIPSEKIFELINKEFGTNFDPVKHSKLKEEAYLKRIDQVKPIEPILKIVEEYHGKMPMSIGTGSPGNDSWRTIRTLGLDKYFDILISKDDVVNGKPDPETFLKCAELMHVRPDRCQVFEDGDPGIKAAIEAGMKVTDVRKYL